MTRYTNFGRKRTYVEAGFNNDPQPEPEPAPAPEKIENTAAAAEGTSEPEKKKRKRIRGKKPKLAAETLEGQDDRDGTGEAPGQARSNEGESRDRFKGGKKFRPADRKQAEKGHTARDCTKSIAADALEGDRGKSGGKAGRDTVGICYRCGSRRHNLSKCKAPVDPENPLPFASCFGIYPNGGCCKLCKETTHLAKDCPLRKKEVTATTPLVGTGREAGADEDDFHTFKRVTAEVDKEEKAEERAKRKADVRVGAHSGVVRAVGDALPEKKKKKVVFF
ncbi:hypothetical protein ACG7TL_003577 [Trametes sanguinea]